ncbi:hypothetical protein A8709_17820 [Paenibacillus pectinilyticus]|uniref:Methyltransferase domain-containing protein n=1 Tax=Paenibacillus pectinilyticus TaxID=512399 RepID=A0A1C0ZZA2_9BACL|nr:class I SAM-dependent methyltransferase [Paenibacillus pectinilyticus]OCT13464.1 hypothetical protein A8709_17820 [Paenibacillus pectinilyticus]
MKSLEQYWNESYQRTDLTLRYDNWLDKYVDAYFIKGVTSLIVDLGCGVGNNTKYLVERGFSPIACDISEKAIKKLNTFMPEIEVHCLDMTQGLPFGDHTVDVLIADLSLHYFDERTTNDVIRDIHRVLNKDGVLLCRLNSINEIANKGESTPSHEAYLLENQGIYRRFFDRGEIERFFEEKDWQYIFAEEYEMDRYTNKKMLWEVALKPKKTDANG